MVKKINVNSDTIKNLLDEKFYDPNKSMVAFEVANGTGSAADRRADAVSFELWPSNDYAITGYEIKVSRSDWLSEMKQPDKSLAISQYCDYWYLVAPAGVLGIDELPEGWGWIQASEKSLRTKIKAKKRKPIDMDACFAASLIRNCIAKYSDKSLLNEKVQQAETSAHDYHKRHYENKIKGLEERIAELQHVLTDFEKKTGVGLSRWNYTGLLNSMTALKERSTRNAIIDEIKGKSHIYQMMLLKNDELIKAVDGWPDD